MRISDWSSDVCSSDLLDRHQRAVLRIAVDIGDLRRGEVHLPVLDIPAAPPPAQVFARIILHRAEEIGGLGVFERPRRREAEQGIVASHWHTYQIGRATVRERVSQYV